MRTKMTDEEKAAKRRERQKKYYDAHKEKCLAKQKRYYDSHQEKEKARLKKYRAENKEKCDAYEHTEARIESRKERNKTYYRNRKDKKKTEGGE